MSAIQSLLRVMTLRDAEAIILETGKIPSLRRRGQIEKLAMPALEAEMLAEFVAPLLAGRSLDDGAVSVQFRDPDGPYYQVAIEKTATGLRLLVRPGKPPAAPAAEVAPPTKQAWWAKPAGALDGASRASHSGHADHAAGQAAAGHASGAGQ